MCVRTRDSALIAALNEMDGTSLFGPKAGVVMGAVLKAQPNRVLLSPIARVEVYSPIPGPGEQSPNGPHTHLLPKLLASGRIAAANSPIPDELQPVLMLHPRSPWRDEMGHRTSFDPSLDDLFEGMLETYALPEDRQVRNATEKAVTGGADPAAYAWPATRRGRIQARITLRRLAQKDGAAKVAAWRSLYDRHAAEDADPEEAMHA